MGLFKYTYDVVQFEHPAKGPLYAVRRSKVFKKDRYFAGVSFLLGNSVDSYWKLRTSPKFEEYLESDKDRVFEILKKYGPERAIWVKSELVITKGILEELLTK